MKDMAIKQAKARARIAIVVLLAMLTTTIFSASTVVFAAGNVKDTSFTFSFNGSGKYTLPRPKEDKTSSYMKLQSISPGRQFYGRVVARSGSSDSSDKIEVGSTLYTFNSSHKNVGRYMINYVKEKGYKYASIYGMPDVNANYTASGLWSPDSV